jgi:hypothetical protein
MLAVGLLTLNLLSPEEAAPRLGQLALCGVGGVLVALALRFAAEGILQDERVVKWRWHVRALTALIGSAVAALPLLNWPALAQ